MSTHKSNRTSSDIYSRTDGIVPPSYRPAHKFYADRDIHEYLQNLPAGTKNATIAKFIRAGMKHHITEKDSLRRFAEFLSLPKNADNKAAQAMAKLFEEFYAFEAEPTLDDAWED